MDILGLGDHSTFVLLWSYKNLFTGGVAISKPDAIWYVAKFTSAGFAYT